MTAVISLAARRREPLKTIVETLERLLEEARAGDITAIAIAHVDGADYTMSEFNFGSADCSKLVGATTHMLYRINKHWDEAS